MPASADMTTQVDVWRTAVYIYMVTGEDGHIHLADFTVSVAAIEKKPESRQMDKWILTPT